MPPPVAVATPFLLRYCQRARIVGRLLVIQLAVSLVLRQVLATMLGGGAAHGVSLIGIHVAGAVTDLLAGMTAALPLLLLLSLWRMYWLGRRWVQHGIIALAATALTFDACVQYFFFEEYSARYNHLALDYLLYPDEVFGNIFASYNVPLFVSLATATGVALALLTVRWPASLAGEWGWKARLDALWLTGGVALVVAAAWLVVPTNLADDRVTNEIASNGWAQLVRAYRTAHLDYEAYYALLPQDQAAARVARMLYPRGDSRRLLRHFEPQRHSVNGPLDVVVILEESLGSSFSARFGHGPEEPVTPELDRWSREGIALTNLIANGNRTVRGLEGVLCSFPPLPGDAIVKRDRSENVASLARVLQEHGYATTFFYGGEGCSTT